ncbi:MAG: dephospho-CoA kinase, partial [Acidobacteria bacterium]|nr:dephospho-CoA kinase [Acidobacteriota bacterium]
ARLMARNRLSREEAQQRIAAQLPQEEKMRHADFLIDNSGDMAGTRKQTEEVYRALRALSQEKSATEAQRHGVGQADERDAQ